MSLPARTGIDWLKQGFGLFRQQPGILTMLLFANFMASMILSSLPWVGPMLTSLLIPAFSIAIMQACNMIAQGQRVMPDVMLTGFRQPALPRLLKLGLVYVGIALVMMLTVRLAVDSAGVQQIQAAAAARAAGQAGAVQPMVPGDLALVTLAWAVVMLLFSFATPLTYWKQMPLFKALFYSVFGIFGAFKPILTMLVAALAAFMLLTVIIGQIFGGNPLLFKAVSTWILLMFALVLQCAMFACYRQIYADPAPDTKL